MLSAARYAGAQEGLYAGVAAGWDRATADYTKGIGLDVPPATHRTATNSAPGGFGTARASLGYRAYLARRTYISTEFEAAFHRGDGAAGYLREGTGLGDRDVWPGPWTVEKNHAFGANARLGYAPGGVLGEGGAVYSVTGVHWLRATVRRGSDIGTESIRNVADLELTRYGGDITLWGEESTMPKTRAAYPLEFRGQMIELVRAGRSPEALGREFEPSAQAIRNWVRQADRDAGRRADGLTTAERTEMQRLRRENATLREEREILKKAAAWFARETGAVPSRSSRSSERTGRSMP